MPLAWRELLDELRRSDLLVAAPADGPMTTGVGMDSRTIESGMLYVAVRGSQADGHRFVGDAVRRGAAAVVVESAQQSGVPEIVVRDGRRAALALGQAWYGHPGRRLALLGVTGTNGKTTTVGILRHLFNAAGGAGSIGTLGAFDGGGRAVDSTAGSLTTPGPIDLQATLAELVARGTTHVAMEASSHSLDQGRLDGLAFAAGVFTNLTRDHLDYHGTMEAYLAAKLGAEPPARRSTGVEVVNLDDDAWQAMAARSPSASPSASTPRPTCGPPAWSSMRQAAAFDSSGRFGVAEAALPLLGDFNVSNAPRRRGHGARARPSVDRGRRTAGAVAAGAGPHGAHQRDALHRAARLRAHARRARARARHAAAAHPRPAHRGVRLRRRSRPGQAADHGPDRRRGRRSRRSPPPTIRAPKTPAPSSTTSSREWAACRTCGSWTGSPPSTPRWTKARAGDTILLAGKGHETYQVLGTEKVPFDEREIVRAATGGQA